MYNKQELKGKGNQIIGNIKEKAGEVLNILRLEDEGELQKAEGKVQEDLGYARRKTGEAVKKAGRKIAGE